METNVIHTSYNILILLPLTLERFTVMSRLKKKYCTSYYGSNMCSVYDVR